MIGYLNIQCLDQYMQLRCLRTVIKALGFMPGIHLVENDSGVLIMKLRYIMFPRNKYK